MFIDHLRPQREVKTSANTLFPYCLTVVLCVDEKSNEKPQDITREIVAASHSFVSLCSVSSSLCLPVYS